MDVATQDSGGRDNPMLGSIVTSPQAFQLANHVAKHSTAWGSQILAGLFKYCYRLLSRPKRFFLKFQDLKFSFFVKTLKSHVSTRFPSILHLRKWRQFLWYCLWTKAYSRKFNCPASTLFISLLNIDQSSLTPISLESIQTWVLNHFDSPESFSSLLQYHSINLLESTVLPISSRWPLRS